MKENLTFVFYLNVQWVYWINFQDIWNFIYQKTLLHTPLLLAFKIVENFQFIFKFQFWWINFPELLLKSPPLFKTMKVWKSKGIWKSLFSCYACLFLFSWSIFSPNNKKICKRQCWIWSHTNPNNLPAIFCFKVKKRFLQ